VHGGLQADLILTSDLNSHEHPRCLVSIASLFASLWMMLRNRQLAEDFSFVVDGDIGVASSLSFWLRAMMKTINTFTVPDDWDGKLHGLASSCSGDEGKARFPCIGQRCWDNPHGPISPYRVRVAQVELVAQFWLCPRQGTTLRTTRRFSRMNRRW